LILQWVCSHWFLPQLYVTSRSNPHMSISSCLRCTDRGSNQNHEYSNRASVRLRGTLLPEEDSIRTLLTRDLDAWLRASLPWLQRFSEQDPAIQGPLEPCCRPLPLVAQLCVQLFCRLVLLIAMQPYRVKAPSSACRRTSRSLQDMNTPVALPPLDTLACTHEKRISHLAVRCAVRGSSQRRDVSPQGRPSRYRCNSYKHHVSGYNTRRGYVHTGRTARKCACAATTGGACMPLSTERRPQWGEVSWKTT